MSTIWPSRLLHRLLSRVSSRLFPTRLTPAQEHILTALVQGAHLKAHRTADGDKSYRLHRADGAVFRTVAAAEVHRLRDAGLVTGNMKFPASTYLLTPAGLRTARRRTETPLQPLTPRG